MAEKKYLDQNGLLYFWNKVKAVFNTKVDKVEGMGLSHNDLTDELKQKILDAGTGSFTGVYNDLVDKPKINNVELAGGNNTLETLGIQAAGDYATTSALNTGLSGKVDKVTGKGLSTNDYTNEDKNKLAGIETGAQVNTIETIKKNGVAIEAGEDKDIDIIVPTKLSELTNDGNFVTDADYVHTDNNFTDALETKLNGITAGAQPNKIEVIKKNGVVVPITSTDKSVDITVATKLSELENDGDFVTDADYVHTDNNYTTADKNKLAGIATGAQVNVIEKINVNGEAATITGKAVSITTPTKVSELSNDSKYQNDTQVASAIETATANLVTTSAMNTAISNATEDLASESWVNTQLANYNKKAVVTNISEMTDLNTIYLMDNETEEPNNVYDEYIVVEVQGKKVAEKIGTTEVDLTNYLKTTDLVAISNGEIDTIMA